MSNGVLVWCVTRILAHAPLLWCIHLTYFAIYDKEGGGGGMGCLMIFLFSINRFKCAIIISISESIVTVTTKDEIADMLANYWSLIVNYEAQLKLYTIEVTLLPFNDGVVYEDVSTLSTADYADYNAFVNAEAGKWKEVEDDIRSKRMSIY